MNERYLDPQEITRCIGVFIAKDMRPFSVVDNVGFCELVRVLEPRYHILSRPHFSQEVIPALYNEIKENVTDVLKKAESVAITTDGWTSRAVQSYITVTAHVITTEWEMKSFVLQTRPLFESHTGTNLADVLKATVQEWELERSAHSIAVVTDNARNMIVAVREAGMSPHIKCFAHTLNLASQAGLHVPRVSRLLGRVRKVVAFFHRSTTATAVLAAKQNMLEIASHKLIMDVVTRWNSSMDMLERYREQQSAITAALLSTEVCKNARQLDTMDSADISDAEEIVNLLKPLKKATAVLSDEKSPTLSLIVPLKAMIEQSMTPDEKDSTTIANMKTAILQNLSSRFTEEQDYLLEGTALDPRFRSLPHLLPEQREEVFHRLKNKSNQLQQAVTVKQTKEGGASAGDPTDAADQRDIAHRVEPEQPPSKKTALEELFGATFSEPQVTQSKSRIEVEIEMYKKDTSIPLTSCPLKWWKENAQMYPLLSPLAKAYLTVPATSVPSECVFSTARDIVNAQRSQLLPENVDMLVFLQKNL